MELLQDALNRVNVLKREDLLNMSKDAQNEEDVVALVTTYIPQFMDLSKIVKRNWELLER